MHLSSKESGDCHYFNSGIKLGITKSRTTRLTVVTLSVVDGFMYGVFFKICRLILIKTLDLNSEGYVEDGGTS